MSSDKYHCGYRVCSQIPIITEDFKKLQFPYFFGCSWNYLSGNRFESKIFCSKHFHVNSKTT